jgi:hypothetical protein
MRRNTAEMAEFMADENRQTLTFPGGSISKMTPEEELFTHVAGQQPHLAVVEQKDRVVHMGVAPDLASAARLLGQLMDRVGGIGGVKFKHAYVRQR